MSNVESSKNGRLNYITLIQIIGMFLIVLSHSISSRTTYPSIVLDAVHSVQMIGLTAFMWCSGYLLVRTDSLGKYGYWKYVGKRALRLLLPFFVIQILMIIPKFLMAKLSGTEIDLSLPGLLRSFFYPREGILPHLWFLPTLMILCLFSFLLVFAAKNKIAKWIVLVGTGVLLFLPSIPNLLGLNDVKLYLFWYYLGILTAITLNEKVMGKIKNTIVIIASTVAYAGFCFVPSVVLSDFFKGLCSIVFLISLTMMIGHSGGGLGRYTFPIYILSLPVQNVVEVLLGILGIHWLLTTLVMFVLGIAIPWVVAVLVRRLEQKWKYKPISRSIGL